MHWRGRKKKPEHIPEETLPGVTERSRAEQPPEPSAQPITVEAQSTAPAEQPRGLIERLTDVVGQWGTREYDTASTPSPPDSDREGSVARPIEGPSHPDVANRFSVPQQDLHLAGRCICALTCRKRIFLVPRS